MADTALHEVLTREMRNTHYILIGRYAVKELDANVAERVPVVLNVISQK
jgi:hypothetical protein